LRRLRTKPEHQQMERNKRSMHVVYVVYVYRDFYWFI